MRDRKGEDPERYAELTKRVKEAMDELNARGAEPCGHGHGPASAEKVLDVCDRCCATVGAAHNRVGAAILARSLEFSAPEDRDGEEFVQWLQQQRQDHMDLILHSANYGGELPLKWRVEHDHTLVWIDAQLRMKEVTRGAANMREMGQHQPVQRLKWKTTTAAFVYVFNTLAEQGYFELPARGGKDGGENFAEYARALLQAFALKKKGDGSAVTPEYLRGRLFPGSPGQLAQAKALKFQVPEARFIVPDAEDLG